MSKEKVYPKGIRVFDKNPKQPDFVKGTMIITLNELLQFCKENEGLLSEYNGQKQLKCQILEGDKGIYMVVDTFSPDASKQNINKLAKAIDADEDLLPFQL